MRRCCNMPACEGRRGGEEGEGERELNNRMQNAIEEGESRALVKGGESSVGDKESRTE